MIKLFATIGLFFFCISIASDLKEEFKPSIVKEKPSVLFVFFDNADPHLQNYLMNGVNAFYKVNSDKDTAVSLPKSAYYKPRNRYKADKLLVFLKDKKNVDYHRIVGFTNKDISISRGKNPDSGIFGLGFCPGPSVVISSYRLKSDSIKCLTVVLHELGHTYGLKHCSSKGCLMRDVNGKMIQVPETGPDLCNKCRKIVFNR